MIYHHWLPLYNMSGPGYHYKEGMKDSQHALLSGAAQGKIAFVTNLKARFRNNDLLQADVGSDSTLMEDMCGC